MTDPTNIDFEIRYYRVRLEQGIEEYFDLLEQKTKEDDYMKRKDLTIKMLTIAKTNRGNDYWHKKALYKKHADIIEKNMITFIHYRSSMKVRK